MSPYYEGINYSSGFPLPCFPLMLLLCIHIYVHFAHNNPPRDGLLYGEHWVGRPFVMLNQVVKTPFNSFFTLKKINVLKDPLSRYQVSP